MLASGDSCSMIYDFIMRNGWHGASYQAIVSLFKYSCNQSKDNSNLASMFYI
ncbi:hypothetical protein RchiOBHm_Chr2g0149091 [Rosa chinensis]|uniref:Uncharacterized protein n=1 Tax=Rosa chinensis TaxID=74649 RepID=A0A2P6RZJ1_ROSCH|nr:hypothetical protein RchiOBHm_Chr2g0149091 [Rosa chinensis]